MNMFLIKPLGFFTLLLILLFVAKCLKKIEVLIKRILDSLLDFRLDTLIAINCVGHIALFHCKH